MTVRAATEAFLAVGWKWGQDQSGPAPTDVDAARKGKLQGGKSKGKGGKDKEKGNSKSKNTEKSERSAIPRLLWKLW